MKERILVKVGGEVAESDELSKTLITDLLELRAGGAEVILCHGGGPQISRELKERGIAPQFVDGQRITDQATLAVTCRVLLGEINPKLVALLNQSGRNAAGLSGLDGALYFSAQREPSLGFVGKIETINPEALLAVIGCGLIPVVASIGIGANGSIYNINADSAAGELARKLEVDKYLLFTNVDGLYRSFSDKSSLIKEIRLSELKDLFEAGSLTEGMIPKIESVIIALEGGVKRAVIVDGRKSHALLDAVKEKINGTLITR